VFIAQLLISIYYKHRLHILNLGITLLSLEYHLKGYRSVI